MIDTKTLKAGDPVYAGWNGDYAPLTVVSVMPSGHVTATFNASGMIAAFLPSGRERNDVRWGWALDLSMPASERRALLDTEQRRKDAAAAFLPIERMIRNRADKDAMVAELARLQAALDAARAKVEAI